MPHDDERILVNVVVHQLFREQVPSLESANERFIS